MSYAVLEDVGGFWESAFLSSLGILSAPGIVEIDRSGESIGRGNFGTFGRMNEPTQFQRRDISTTSATRSFTEMSSQLEKGVVLHDDNADSYLEAQTVFSGFDFQAWWRIRSAMWMARRIKQQCYRVAKAAVEAAQTSDGSTALIDAHVSDVYSGTTQAPMTIQRLHNARAKMGDAAGLLTVAVMHSDVWNDLVADGLTNYKSTQFADLILNSGFIRDSSLGNLFNRSDIKRAVRTFNNARLVTCDALGMSIIVDDDISSISMTGTTYTYKTKYETLLAGPGSLFIGYQGGEPRTNVVVDLDDARGAVIKCRTELDYLVHVPGVKWDSETANPSDAALGTKSNWASTYTDHRQLLLVKAVTN